MKFGYIGKILIRKTCSYSQQQIEKSLIEWQCRNFNIWGTGRELKPLQEILYVHSQTITALNFHNYVDEIHILMSESRLCWSVSKVKVISAPKIINSEINYICKQLTQRMSWVTVILLLQLQSGICAVLAFSFTVDNASSENTLNSEPN